MARFAIVVFAGLGIAGLFVPLHPHSESLFDSVPHPFFYQLLGGFVLAFLAGALGGGYGIARWSALIAGIALGFVLSRISDSIHEYISTGGTGARLIAAGVIGGILASIAAAIWPPAHA